MNRHPKSTKENSAKRLRNMIMAKIDKLSLGKEKYSIIIASETDARKKTYELRVTRKTIIAAMAGVVLVVAAFAALTVISVLHASHYSAKANSLKSDITIQSSLAETYAGEIDSIGSKLNELRDSMRPAAASE